MTNQQILEKAIQKAIDGGWLSWYKKPIKRIDIHYEDDDDESELIDIGLNGGSKDVQFIGRTSINSIIFNHDFAKSLWGEFRSGDYPSVTYERSSQVGGGTLYAQGLYDWQYHLQRMVIAEDRIEYLGANI